MDHVDRCEDSLAVNRHKMRCIVTKCASQRCKDAEGSCRARYKILKYMEVDYVVIYEQGEHCMAIDAPPSPVSSPELTTEMKDYIVSKLEDAPSMVPLLAYSFMSRELTSGRIAGQAPALEKVQNSVKTWRGKNKPDRMEPVLEICRQSIQL
ncbi:hypothetical protein PF004_g26238 [Phytophthora fragariae]|uniref:Uncharacterized protein n=1 Tax=Phytophthora fragariae TaxID=53985 RepID=A0A6A3HXZ9_9STRA|nr:hypothetical protein PF011_g25506 [Phytophthora fragariae]KAE9175949.1 hypothetical protein PF004_g26238 [Phytophthora fragariae]